MNEQQTAASQFSDALNDLQRLLQERGGQTGVAGVIIVTTTPDEPGTGQPTPGFAAQETALPQRTLGLLLSSLSEGLSWPDQVRVAGLSALIRFQFDLTPRVVNDRPVLTCPVDSLRLLLGTLTDLRDRVTPEPEHAGRA